MAQKGQGYFDTLLKFVSSFDEWDSFHNFYNISADYFTKELGAVECLFVSLPSAPQEGGDYRILFSSREKTDFPVLETLAREKTGLGTLGEGQWFLVENESTSVLKLGTFNMQSYFLVSCGEELLPGSEGRLEVLEFLGNFLRKGFSHVRKWHALSEAKSLIHVDDVTGLFNQRKLMQDLDFLIEREKKSGDVFSVLFIDIDHFKNVNDEYGHIPGTQLLVVLAGILKSNIRSNDYAYRYGGDEFIMLLPGIEENTAVSISERLLDTIRKHEFRLGADEVYSMSVSIGVAQYPRDAHSREEIVSFADQMMYHAKATGRGRVCRAADAVNVEPLKKNSNKSRS